MAKYYRKIIYAIFSAITSTHLRTYRLDDICNTRNECVNILTFNVVFLGFVVRSFDVVKELHTMRSQLKAHWDYWDKLVATKKDVGAIYLPFVTLH